MNYDKVMGGDTFTSCKIVTASDMPTEDLTSVIEFKSWNSDIEQLPLNKIERTILVLELIDDRAFQSNRFRYDASVQNFIE